MDANSHKACEEYLEIHKGNIHNKVLVSVWCITYNHADSIRDTLEGFLMQKTTFQFNVLVFDDASTDGTSDIVRECAERYPDIINVVIAKKNTWHKPERKEIYSYLWEQYLTGKYIALCEGDDFWIDPYKLQIQIDYLESHAECCLYIHNALWLNCQSGEMKAGNPYDGMGEKDISPEEAIMMYKGHPPTASYVCKKEIMTERPSFFMDAPVGDYTFVLYALLHGEIHYSDRIMSVYRWQKEGSYTMLMRDNKMMRIYFDWGLLDFLTKYNNYTEYIFNIWCRNQIQAYASVLIAQFEKSGNLEKYLDGCREQGFYLPEECRDYICGLENLRKQMKDENYLSDELKGFLSKHKNIIVMGAGKYAAILSKQLANNHIDFQGFAVTKKKDGEETYMGKPVWNLSDIPYDKADTGIAIGILPTRWEQILQSLLEAGIPKQNFYCPFLWENQGL